MATAGAARVDPPGAGPGMSAGPGSRWGGAFTLVALLAGMGALVWLLWV